MLLMCQQHYQEEYWWLIIIDYRNAFNGENGTDMMWEVWYEWPSLVKFNFN